MNASRFAALMFAAASPMIACGARAGDVFASAPIEPAMFREGEVRRSAEVFGRWSLVCDAIPRLGHRFCSLNAAPTPIGTGMIALTVSTGDDGRPAALLRTPFGLSLPFGVRVKANTTGSDEPERRIPMALCSATACEAVWTLNPGDLMALRAGHGLRIAVQGWHFGGSSRAKARLAPVYATIDGLGFADAVAASLH